VAGRYDGLTVDGCATAPCAPERIPTVTQYKRFKAFGFTTDCSVPVLLQYAATAPSPGLIPHASLECQPGGTRPYGRKHFFGSPEDGPPKQVLAPGPMRIGAAWEHEDGEGLTLQLDLLPVTGGRIVLRKPKEDDHA
jgi:hypothetical protein